MSSGYTLAEIDQMNRTVRNWTQSAKRQMKSNAAGTNLASNLKTSTRSRDGQIFQAKFQFFRYGVFYEMGVFGGLTKEEAIAQGKLKPKPWFNPVIHGSIRDLEKSILDINEGFVIDALNSKIKNT